MPTQDPPVPSDLLVHDDQAFAALLREPATQIVPCDGGFPRMRMHQDRTWDTGGIRLAEHLCYIVRRGACRVEWLPFGAAAPDPEPSRSAAAELGPGHAFILPPYLNFRCCAIGPGKLLLARFRFTVRAYGRAVAWSRAPRLFPMDATRESLADLIANELPHGDATLLSCLTRAFCLAVLGTTGEPGGLSQDQVAELGEVIRRHPGTVTPHDLARRLGLGLDWATRLIRRATDYPPRTWIVRERIRLACALLADGQSPDQVAARLGYADHRLFSRQFRTVIGCPPATWAKRTRRE